MLECTSTDILNTLFFYGQVACIKMQSIVILYAKECKCEPFSTDLLMVIDTQMSVSLLGLWVSWFIYTCIIVCIQIFISLSLYMIYRFICVWNKSVHIGII